MIDFMPYNPKVPDPISVAAYITRFYAKQEGLYGGALQQIYSDSLQAAEQVLPGQSNIDIQTAIDLVEQTRRPDHTAYAKFIPRQPDLRQSITARSKFNPYK